MSEYERLVVNVEAALAARLWDHADELEEQGQIGQATATRVAARHAVRAALSLDDNTDPATLEPYRMEPLDHPEIVARKQDSAADQAADLRKTRNGLLAASDWTQVPDAPVDQKAWAAYRQKLRDLPAKTKDPANPTWPKAPK